MRAEKAQHIGGGVTGVDIVTQFETDFKMLTSLHQKIAFT